MNQKLLASLAKKIKKSSHTVFFGGAGVSTDSGIPDFRGPQGLYRTQGEGREYFLSRSCLQNEPERFWQFYRENMVYPDAKPNESHRILADWERRGLLQAVITQNVDGLHQKAGSRRVIELHGTGAFYDCISCKEAFGEEILAQAEILCRCPRCGGVVRPRVTLYEEPLNADAYWDAKEQLMHAELLIVGGSSLTVWPAAGLVQDFTGELFLVNLSPTAFDEAATVLRDPLAEVLKRVNDLL